MSDTETSAATDGAETSPGADPEASAVAPLTWRKKLLFSAVLLFIMLAVLEGAAQVYVRAVRGYAGGEFLQYEFDPYKNIHLSRNWEDTRGARHNLQGFRRDENVSREKADGTFRVFLMGASTAYGLGGQFPHIQTEFAVLDNSETIDAYLEPLLQEALPYEQVEVINAGIPSIWTHHHLIYLNQTILNYDPDLILFLDGWNDHYFYDRGHDQFYMYAQTEQAGVIMGPPTLRSLFRMNAWWLFRKSAAAHVGMRAVQELMTVVQHSGQPPTAVDVDTALEDLEYVFERNALRMIERNALILENEGIPAIFMLQPVFLLERDRYQAMPAAEKELFDFNVGWQGNLEEFMTAATPLLADRIDRTVSEHGGTFVDLTGIYGPEETEQIYTDYAHLTPLGNRLLAEYLVPIVTEVVGTAPDGDAAESATGGS